MNFHLNEQTERLKSHKRRSESIESLSQLKMALEGGSGSCWLIGMMADERLRGFHNGWTDRQTFVIVESLLQLKTFTV